MNSVVNNPIYSITPFTLLDYPDKTACILWFAGCNMRCDFCYNPAIIESKGKLSCEQALLFLKSRKGLLDGVVLSGGECTSYKGLIELIREIRRLGMLVKLDTNGSNPKMIQQLVEENLVDYVALDFKASKEKFFQITKSKLFEKFERSLVILVNGNVEFEVRTTVHNDLLSKEDLDQMIDYLVQKGYKKSYFIQQFINDIPTVGSLGYSKNELEFEDFKASDLNIVLRN